MKKQFKFIVIATITMLISSCSDPENAERVLQSNGYTNIEITGWEPLMKSEDDMYSTGFRATSPSGQIVEGVVTGGMLKGNTIRLK